MAAAAQRRGDPKQWATAHDSGSNPMRDAQQSLEGIERVTKQMVQHVATAETLAFGYVNGDCVLLTHEG